MFRFNACQKIGMKKYLVLSGKEVSSKYTPSPRPEQQRYRENDQIACARITNNVRIQNII